MRVVRELAMQHAVNTGRVLLHAAALEVDGRAMAILGPRRAGKTTLLLHLLEAGGARYIANDRVCVEPGGTGVRLTGLPSIVSLRAGTLALFPDLHARAAASGCHFGETQDECRAARERQMRRDVDLTPAQLCDLMGVQAATSTPLAVMLFPQADEIRDAAAESGSLSAMSTAQRVRDSLFGGGALERRTGMFAALLEGCGRPHEPYAAAKGRSDVLCETLARTIPAFACRVAPSALPDAHRATALIRRLVAEAGY
jgi:hypothetical protein